MITNFIHVSELNPSLPFPIAGSKALDSVECFLFVEPATRIIEGEVSTLVAPAILFAKDWFYFRHQLPLASDYSDRLIVLRHHYYSSLFYLTTKGYERWIWKSPFLNSLFYRLVELLRREVCESSMVGMSSRLPCWMIYSPYCVSWLLY